MIESAIAHRMSQHEVAPASKTPRDRSPNLLDLPTFATISTVESLPFSAATFMAVSAVEKSFPVIGLVEHYLLLCTSRLVEKAVENCSERGLAE